MINSKQLLKQFRNLMVKELSYDYRQDIPERINKSIQKEDYHVMTRRRSNSININTTEDFFKANEIIIRNGLQEAFLEFNQAPIQEVLSQCLIKVGYTTPSPIQACSWPPAFKGRDCLAIAKTGSGKTCGYLMPGMTEILKRGRVPSADKVRYGPSMLIMAPTRELCQQIQLEAEKFGRPAGISSCAIYGGASKGPQIGDLMRGQDVIVATPGRLLDFLKMTDYKTGKLVAKLERTFILVLDEADRMLDMGFEEDIKKIISHMTNKDIQSLFFTATWPKEVQRCAYSILKNPVEIRIGNPDKLVSNKDIKQEVIVCPPEDKFHHLKKHLSKLSKEQRILIFINTKSECQSVARNLYRDGYNIAAIHGDLDQAQREAILQRFKSGRDPVLVATDVAARGLDIKDVEVVNYDFPNQVEDYIHRIGRSGRAGAQGRATTFFTQNDAKHSQGLIDILKTADQYISPELVDMAEEIRRNRNSKRDKNRPARYMSRGFGNRGFSGDSNGTSSGYQGNRYQGSGSQANITQQITNPFAQFQGVKKTF